jgi:CBS domain-containing protein
VEDFVSVEELMVPLDEYVTVDEQASLFEAVMALEAAQEKQDRQKQKYLHRAILVYDKQNRIAGKISQLDVLMALEPRYKDVGDMRALSRAGLSAQFIKSMVQNMAFCDSTLIDMCGKAARIKVKDFMHKPEEGECIEIDQSLCEAIHMLLVGRHQSLLVLKDAEIVGILRLTDVFMKIFGMMKSCEL